jgi:hypothetical protein
MPSFHSSTRLGLAVEGDIPVPAMISSSVQPCGWPAMNRSTLNRIEAALLATDSAAATDVAECRWQGGRSSNRLGWWVLNSQSSP